MKKKIFTLILILSMMISVVNPVLATEVSKQQVPEKVQWLINKGWVKGRGNGLDLDKTITRAEVTKMVALVADYEQEANNAKSTQGSFTDVDPAHWANGYINVAANKGYIMGYPDKTFKPENPITNAEIMTILVKLHPEWKTSLTEGKVWPTAEVTFAKNSNILKGINNLDGKNNENAIRQDVFEMIYNLCQERIRLTVKNAEKQVGVKENTKPSTINWWWNSGYVVNREYVVRFYDINKTQIYTKYVAEGDRVLNINAPKVDGFNFEGWADRNTGKYFDFNDRVYRDIDLIAKYSTDMAKIKPAEPKPVEPKPVEPKPVEPKPVEPKPVEPKPVEPKPVEPKPVEPKPVEPKPVEPKPVEPKPVEPKPVEPKPVEPKPVEPKPVEPKPVEPKPVEPKPGELDKQIEAEANAQLKETIEKAKNALEENKNEPAKAAEELKTAIAKAEKVLSEGNVEAKTNETTTLNDARIKYLNAAAELNKQIEAEANTQLKETIEKAKKALKENNNEPAKAAEELKTAIAKAEKVLSEGSVEAKTNETTTLNDARIKYLNIATETEKLNKLLAEALPLYQDKNVSDEFKTAYKEANKVAVNGESLEEVKEAISKLEKAIAKEKELKKQIEAEKDKIDKLDLSEKQKEFFKNKIDKAGKTTSVKSVFEKIQKDAKALVEKITSAKFNFPALEYLTQEEVLKAFDEATTPDEVDKAVESLKTKNEEIKEGIEKIKEENRIEYKVKTTPEDATVKITELGTDKPIMPVEGKKYILDKQKNYQLSVSKEGYISKNQIIVGSKLNSILKKEVMLTVKKGTLTISNGEGYTFEENKKIIIDKSKLQEKDSKYSVILKVNSNNNDNVLYTLDNNDKATLDAELKGKVSLDSNTGKFEFNKDLEVETIYKAKASAKGYEPLEFEIVIENGTSSTDSPSQGEPQDEPSKEPKEVTVIFKLQDGGVSAGSQFAENGKTIIEKLSTQGTTIKVPRVNFKQGVENTSLEWYDEGGKRRDVRTGNNVFIKLNEDEASTLTIIGGYKKY